MRLMKRGIPTMGRFSAVFTTAVALSCLAALAPPPAASQTCVGDCSGNARVDIAELVLGVGIALGNQPPSRCSTLDSSGNGHVEINELIAAVENALSACGRIPPPCEGGEVDRGLCYLAKGNLSVANGLLRQALRSNPNDNGANLYYAMTRIATTLLEDDRIRDLLDRSGVIVHGGSASLCDLDIDSSDEVPLGAPRSGEIIDTVREVIVPEITGALENVRQISSDVNLRFDLRHLASCVDPPTDVAVVDIDGADVLALEAGIEGLAAIVDLLASYNLDASLRTAIDESPRTLLGAGPALLTLRSAATLSSAREHFDVALGKASQAIEVMQAETDDQSDDILVILPEDAEDAAKGKRVLDLFRQSLRGEVVVPVDIVMDIGLPRQERLNLSRFFSGEFESLRPFLPAFDQDGEFDTGRFPDPTFGGSTRDLTQEDISNLLSRANSLN